MNQRRRKILFWLDGDARRNSYIERMVVVFTLASLYVWWILQPLQRRGLFINASAVQEKLDFLVAHFLRSSFDASGGEASQWLAPVNPSSSRDQKVWTSRGETFAKKTITEIPIPREKQNKTTRNLK